MPIRASAPGFTQTGKIWTDSRRSLSTDVRPGHCSPSQNQNDRFKIEVFKSTYLPLQWGLHAAGIQNKKQNRTALAGSLGAANCTESN